ncbi:putative transposase [Trichonephila clavipes]|nr:putative transposase [Trichonephila clavipes]
MENIQTAVTDQLKAIPKSEFHQCYDEWKKRLQRCVASEGSYFEGDNVELYAYWNKQQESLHQVHLTFPRNSVTHQALLFIQLSQGNAPAVQKKSRSKERAGTGKERLYPLHKSHTTQVTASKARQSRLMSPGTPELYR